MRNIDLMDKQTRVFAPFTSDYAPENWYENVLGRIIKPIIEKWENLDWFWFSKYVHALGNNEDCDVSQISGVYTNKEYGNITTSVRFRYSIDDSLCKDFEISFEKAVRDNSCFLTDFRSWDKVGDVGSGRHIGGQINAERKKRRAERNTKLYHQISLLTLDMLEGPDNSGNFKTEVNNAPDIPFPKSSFSTPHHLFCNITGIPLQAKVKVWVSNGQISVRTETGWGVPGYFGGQSTGNEIPNLEVNMPINF